MIKALAFDLGGVLFALGKPIALEELAKKYGYNPQIVNEILTSPLSKELRKGLITDKQFWNWAKEQLPKEYNAHLIKKEWYLGYILDKDIFSLIKKLKGKYKLIAFSDNLKSRVKFLNNRYNFRKYFDLEVYSFDYHLGKSDKEFFELMIAKSAFKPEEIVYIDNREKNIILASSLGIHSIIYSRGEIIKLLKELQGLSVEI